MTRRRLKATIVGLAVLSLAVISARYDTIREYTPRDKEFYLSQSQLLFIRPGLEFRILEFQIPEDRRPVVTFSITDPKGLPLDLDGVYTYTFKAALPEGYDANATHTIAGYARRDLTEFDLERYSKNDWVHFVPSGAAVTQVRCQG